MRIKIFRVKVPCSFVHNFSRNFGVCIPKRQVARNRTDRIHIHFLSWPHFFGTSSLPLASKQSVLNLKMHVLLFSQESHALIHVTRKYSVFAVVRHYYFVTQTFQCPSTNDFHLGDLNKGKRKNYLR
jgi:hypothetical protein